LVRTSIEGQSIADGFYEKLIGSTPLPPMSALGQKQTYALQQAMSALPPRPNRGIKLLTGCDLTATRAAALYLQQADELARVFAKSNTKRPTGSADLVRSPDTSRSSRQSLDIPGIQRCACRDPARQARYMQATSVTCKVRKKDDR
jgi:hypothetical protein